MQELLKEVEQFKEDNKDNIQKRTCGTPNDILTFPQYIEIILRNNKQKIVAVAQADIEDLEVIKKYKWCLAKKGYVTTSINGKTFSMHKILLNPPKENLIHHINQNKLDNRRNNLKLLKKEDHTMLLHRKQQKQTIINMEISS